MLGIWFIEHEGEFSQVKDIRRYFLRVSPAFEGMEERQKDERTLQGDSEMRRSLI
jgi:hypothetical protein